MTSCANCLWLLQWIVQLVQLVQVAARTNFFFVYFYPKIAPHTLFPDSRHNAMSILYKYLYSGDTLNIINAGFFDWIKYQERYIPNKLPWSLLSATVTQAIWYQGKSALFWCFLTSYTTLFRQCWSPPTISLKNLFGESISQNQKIEQIVQNVREAKSLASLQVLQKWKKERKSLLNLKLNVTSCMTISVECFSKIFSSHHYQGDHTGAGCHICIIHCHRELWHNKTGKKKKNLHKKNHGLITIFSEKISFVGLFHTMTLFLTVGIDVFWEPPSTWWS